MKRIAFLDFGGADYTVEQAYQQPLGGSHSAMCYLAEVLADQGYEVFLLNGTSQPGRSRGVMGLNWNAISPEFLQSLDAAIVLNSAGQGITLRSALGPMTQLILWNQHAEDQPAIQALQDPQEQQVYDGFALVSEWQRDRFCETFGLDPTKIRVLRNAIAPAFQHLFTDQPILAEKTQPPTLAYTSTPFRGLDVLLRVFPRIQQAIPGVTLKVFSSMKGYHLAQSQDEAQYGTLYQQCRTLAGVDYLGGLSQPDLAQELRTVTALAYPNTFPETSCIAVMEAMASGCQIITSQLGALAETTAGFAQLIPVQSDWREYDDRFVAATVDALQRCLGSQQASVEAHLQQQVNYVNRTYTWSARAAEWLTWLEQLWATERVLDLTTATAGIPAGSSQPAYQALMQGNYQQAAELYEQAIAADPTTLPNYWYLGLTLLIQGHEAEAQATWMMAMVDAESDQVEQWTTELLQILETEATRQAAIAADQTAWLIRQHIRDANPTDLKNLLQLVQLSIRLETWVLDDLLPAIIQLLPTYSSPHAELLASVVKQVLEADPANPLLPDLVTACLSANPGHQTIRQLYLAKTAQLLEQHLLPNRLLIPLVEVCWQLEPNNLSILATLANLYQEVGEFEKSLQAAQTLLERSDRLEDQLTANHLQIRGLLNTGGKWQQAFQAYQTYEHLLRSLIETNADLDPDYALQLMVTTAFPAYLADQPKRTHEFRNQFAQFCQTKVQSLTLPLHLKPAQTIKTETLRIGYLSNCLYRHSIGWLSRWLFKYHDTEQFQIHIYSLNPRQDDIQQFIAGLASNYHDISHLAAADIASAIAQDGIQILVDLDSITTPLSSTVLARKPAPVQVTWLGWDASGLPAIDYFLADPYVLPELAQDYYTARVWRLPTTYIAVDGFEFGVPTIHRRDLGIPGDAVVYLSSQTGLKRHPDNMRSQLKIIRSVPNSYFLIRALGDHSSIQTAFEQMADEEGVSRDRLRFLPEVDSEEIYRANLSIADVVLDTFPYNGATTTLETLWLGIPLVTQVGEQFASRNSYTMLMNTGVTAGIAWTGDEYIEWGIRLGREPLLRQQISQQLQASRQTSALWNAKQFTREVEQAYRQMWERARS